MKQIESFVRQWPRAVFFMLTGALIGYILWMFLPQQYTATAKLSVSINYNRTGKMEDLEADRVLGITEDVIHSDEVMRPVFESSSDEDYLSFFSKTGTTRTNNSWSLSITGSDPEETGRLTLLWLKTAYNALQNAHTHAITAEALQNELDGMSRCIQDKANGSIASGCPEDMKTVQENIQTYTNLIQEELQASHGVSSAIQIGPENPDQLELHAASRTAAADTLLGMFCGLLAAFAICWFSANGEQE